MITHARIHKHMSHDTHVHMYTHLHDDICVVAKCLITQWLFGMCKILFVLKVSDHWTYILYICKIQFQNQLPNNATPHLTIFTLSVANYSYTIMQ